MLSEPGPPVQHRPSAAALPILLSLLLAACGGGPKAVPSTVTWPTGAACLALLRDQGITPGPWPAPTRGACAVDTPVLITRAGPLLTPPLGTSCSMALAWAGLVPELDRIARAELGSGIRAVRHFGSYACRGMSSDRSRPSLHSRARAIDIAGFELEDGRVIMVEQDWDAWGAKGRFLEAATQAACRRMSAVLTPETDSDHADHLHLDIGPWRLCDL